MSNFRIYNEQLCPDVWDSAQHLDQEVRVNLLQMAYDFYEKTNLPAPIIDVYFMGSLANYNWNSESDADVHVIVDYKQLQMPEETANKTVKTAGAQWNQEHNVFVKGHKVEMNIQNSSEIKPHVTGIYSLVKDQWIRQPSKVVPQLDMNVIQTQYRAMYSYIENTIRTGDVEQIKSAKKYLDAYRQYGLDTVGELSYENIIFKILRSRGVIKRLRDSITSVYDQQMSVDEVGEKDLKQRHPQTQNWQDSTPRLETLTLDNLNALRAKAARMVKGTSGDEDSISKDINQIALRDFIRFNAEIKRRLEIINRPITEGRDPNYNAALDFMERRDRALYDILTTFKKSKGKGTVPWKTVPARLLKKVWLQFGKYKKIDENDLDKISDQLLTNIAALQACNDLSGHGSHGIDSEVEEMGFTLSKEEWNVMWWDYLTTKSGHDILSDYGMEPLKKLYSVIFTASTPEDKLYACDKVLNVVHQRNDLSELFVEGGSATLTHIANMGGYDAGYSYGDVNQEFRMEESCGAGAGIPEDDRLKIYNQDGSVRRWQIRSKDAPKTPQMTDILPKAIKEFEKPNPVTLA